MDIEAVMGNVSKMADGLTVLLWVACIISGIMFIVVGVSRLCRHRSNPQIWPLGIGIMYVLCGLVLLIIPFFETVFHRAETGNIFYPKAEKMVPMFDPDATWH